MADENPPGPAQGTGTGPPTTPPEVAGRRASWRWHLRRPRIRKRVLIPIAALLLILVGAVLWRYFSSYESTDDAQVDVHLYPVSARVSGHVLLVNVDDNQWVDKGAVLVEIDPKDYEVAVAQAQANLDASEATARSLNITVPITSVNTSSHLASTAADVENARAGWVLFRHRHLPRKNSWKPCSASPMARAREILAKL